MTDTFDGDLLSTRIFQPGPYFIPHFFGPFFLIWVSYQIIHFIRVFLIILQFIDAPKPMIKNIFIVIYPYRKNGGGGRVLNEFILQINNENGKRKVQ